MIPGVDMIPIIIPFQNFNSEQHRTLQAIPQTPVVTAVAESRLLVTWYDREVKIWKIDRVGESSSARRIGSEDTGRKLVSRLVLEVHYSSTLPLTLQVTDKYP